MSTLATLSLPAFDVLWEGQGAGPVPFPFDVPHHGRTLDERARVKADVHADLERRNLARRGRPEPDLEDALRLLARPDLRITVMGMPDAAKEELLRAAVVARGGYAVLVVQEADAVRLDVVRDRSPAVAAVGVLPWQRPGQGRPVTVPASALRPQPGTDLTQRVRQGADDVKALHAMLAGPVVGTGHVTVSVGGREPLPPLTWIDTAQGRYLCTGTDWITVAPADQGALAQRINRALSAPPGR